MRGTTVSGALLVISSIAAAQHVPTGPAVGTLIPAFETTDLNGHPQTLGSLTGPKGLVLVFIRSADW